MTESNNLSIYLLPHEVNLVTHEEKRQQLRLHEASQIVGEAMGQSSETWHDNAPADVALHELSKLRGRLNEIGFLLKQAVVIDYPHNTDDSVGIGSRVSVHIPTWNETFDTIITGEARNFYPPNVTNNQIELMSYNSPIASVILDKKPGDSCNANVSGKDIVVQILTIDQEFILQLAESIYKALAKA